MAASKLTMSVEEKEHTRDLAWKMYTEQKHCDFTLHIGKFTRRCHKSVLCSVSDVFDSLCDSGRNELTVDVSISKDSEKVIEQVIRFFYLGTIELDHETIQQVLAIGHAVKCMKLMLRGEQYLKSHVNVENVTEYVRLAEEYGLGKVQTACNQVTRDNFGHLMHSSDFLASLTTDELASYLHDDALNVEREEDVLHAIIMWLDASQTDTTEKERTLDFFLPAIRLNHCDRGRLQALMKDAASLPSELNVKILGYVFLHEDTEPTPPRFSYAHRDRIIIVGGRKSRNIETGEIRFLDSDGEDTKITEADMLASTISCFHSITMHGTKILISGGYRQTVKKSVRQVNQFDLLTRLWSKMQEMPRGRDSHVTACTDHQMIVMAGCYREPLDSIMCYYTEVDVLDLTSQQWSQRAAMPGKVKWPGVAVVSGNIIIMGGNDPDNKKSLKTYRYEVSTDRWSTCQDMPEHKQYFVPSTAVVDKKIYVLAHKDLLVYDVLLDAWSCLSAHPRPSYMCAMVILHNNKLMSLGGDEHKKPGYDPHGDVHSYDISKNSWRKEEATMPVPLSFHAAFSVQLPTSLYPAH